MKRLVTFDAAGTLIEHSWDPAAIARTSAQECGIPVSPIEAEAAYSRVAAAFREELVELEKQGDRAAIYAQWLRQMAAWLEDVGADPSAARDVFEEFRRRAFAPGSRVFGLFSDVAPTLEALNEKGLALGVISNWDHTLHTVLDNLGVSQKFAFTIASLEFGCEKPDRRIFEEALRLAGVTAEETLHVGDSYEDDFEGARSAGVDALLIDRRNGADLASGRISSLVQVVEAACA